jgi:hypothetical protein
MAQRFLFIGGPADGRRIDLVDSPPTVRFFSYQVEDQNKKTITDPNAMIVTIYKRVSLTDTLFYAEEGMSSDEALDRLIDGYTS